MILVLVWWQWGRESCGPSTDPVHSVRQVPIGVWSCAGCFVSSKHRGSLGSVELDGESSGRPPGPKDFGQDMAVLVFNAVPTFSPRDTFGNSPGSVSQPDSLAANHPGPMRFAGNCTLDVVTVRLQLRKPCGICSVERRVLWPTPRQTRKQGITHIGRSWVEEGTDMPRLAHK